MIECYDAGDVLVGYAAMEGSYMVSREPTTESSPTLTGLCRTSHTAAGPSQDDISVTPSYHGTGKTRLGIQRGRRLQLDACMASLGLAHYHPSVSGAARALMVAAAKVAEAAGDATLSLDVRGSNESAIRFYERMGLVSPT